MIRRPPRSTLFPLHDALPISAAGERWKRVDLAFHRDKVLPPVSLYKIGETYFVEDGNHRVSVARYHGVSGRSEEHTSELQSRQYLVCRLLLEKKKHATRGADH